MGDAFSTLRGCFWTCLLILAALCASAWGLSNSTGPNGSNVQALHALGYTGQNIKIGLISVAHARVTHEAFAGAVTWYDATGENFYEPSSHDTQMAGIAASRGGAAYPEAIGLAPDTEILTVRVTRPIDGSSGRNYSFAWLENGLNEIKNQNGRVVMTGIEIIGPDPDGGSQESLLYDYYAYEHDMIFATASGNQSTSITVFGDTFNSITTGGLIYAEPQVYRRIGTNSGTGPTADADGRRKPEAAAPTQQQFVPKSATSDTFWGYVDGNDTAGLTSWAVPHTAGVAAVLLGFAETTAEPDDGRSEVIKAVMVNATFPNILAKNGTWTDPASVTWHAHRGYGRLDALRAFETLSAPKLAPGQTAAAARGWTYRPFSTSGLTDSYYVEAAANSRLLTTLTWHRQVTIRTGGNPTLGKYRDESSPRLSLDLRIFDPDGIELFADTGGPDNLRKADILLPADGVYELRITNTTSKSNRAYALAFERLDPLPGDWNTDYSVNLIDLEMLIDAWVTDCDLSVFAEMAAHWLTRDLRYWGP